MSDKKKFSLSMRILIAMVLGAITGWVISLLGTPTWAQLWLIDGAFRVLGQIFIALLQMLVVPLVFVSLVCGMTALRDLQKMGRIGIKTVGLYLLTTAVAISINS